MCSISPDFYCHRCLMESYGQQFRFPVEEMGNGVKLCAVHKRQFLIARDAYGRLSDQKSRQSAADATDYYPGITAESSLR